MNAAEETRSNYTSPATEAMLLEWASKVRELIVEDMLHGIVPTEVGSFAGLHDYVDANQYVIDAGVPFGPGDPRAGGEGIGTVNRVVAFVDAMLPLAFGQTVMLRDLVIEGWAARMVRDLQNLGSAGQLTDPHATTLTGLGIPVPADLLAEGMGEDEGVEAVFLNVRAALPAHQVVLVDDGLTDEVLSLVLARLPLFVTLDDAQATALHEVVETALATPGFIDPRCEDERPGLERLGQRLCQIKNTPGRAPEFAALHHGEVTDLYQILEIAVQEPIAWPPAGAERPSLEDLFALLGRVQQGGTA